VFAGERAPVRSAPPAGGCGPTPGPDGWGNPAQPDASPFAG